METVPSTTNRTRVPCPLLTAPLAHESIVESLTSLLLGTRLEADLPGLLRFLFRRNAERIDRELDDSDARRTNSVEFKRLIEQGPMLVERRNA